MRVWAIAVGLVMFGAGCGSSHPAGEDDAGGGGDAGRRRDGGELGIDAGRPRDGGPRPMRDSGPEPGDDAGPLPDAGPPVDASAWAGVTCATPPPDGAEAPPPLPTYAGTCPTLRAGHNALSSTGHMRDFRLVLPATMAPGETYPVFFLWHWLGGSADDFYERGEVQAAADAQRFIAVIPEARDDLRFKWPYLESDSMARFTEEVTFFDDMLACVGAQFAINRQCVTSVGVSAGGLWTSQLAGARGHYLSSVLSLSGGTGGALVRPWTSSTHRVPAVVLWGGPSDWCFVDFDETSRDLEMNLARDGHFFVECIHNCTHAEPPLMGASSRYSSLWDFVLQHPYWLPAGASPYLADGLPSAFPEWCGIGAGSATIREGMCPGSACF